MPGKWKPTSRSENISMEAARMVGTPSYSGKKVFQSRSYPAVTCPTIQKIVMKVLGNIAPGEETTQPKFLFDFSNSAQLFTFSVDPFYSP